LGAERVGLDGQARQFAARATHCGGHGGGAAVLDGQTARGATGPDRGLRGDACTFKRRVCAQCQRSAVSLCANGGHTAAAGCSVTEEQFDLFRDRMLDYARNYTHQFVVDTFYDMEIPAALISFDSLDAINRVEPLSGDAFSKPTFVTRHLKVLRIHFWGNEKRHISLTLQSHSGDTVICNGWNFSDRNLGFLSSWSGGFVDIAYTMEIASRYPDNSLIVRANLLDIQPSQKTPKTHYNSDTIKKSVPNMRKLN
jgi:hypothetical protein